MLECILSDGSIISANDIKSKLQGPFFCPYCKTDLVMTVPGLAIKHFRHRKDAPSDCPLRVYTYEEHGDMDFRGEMKIYTHAIPRNKSNTSIICKVIIADKDNDVIYKSIGPPQDKYNILDFSTLKKNAAFIAINEGMERGTVCPHSSVTVITSNLFAHKQARLATSVPKDNVIHQTAYEAYGFLRSAEILHVSKEYNLAYFTAKDWVKHKKEQEERDKNAFNVDVPFDPPYKGQQIHVFGSIDDLGGIYCKTAVTFEERHSVYRSQYVPREVIDKLKISPLKDYDIQCIACLWYDVGDEYYRLAIEKDFRTGCLLIASDKAAVRIMDNHMMRRRNIRKDTIGEKMASVFGGKRAIHVITKGVYFCDVTKNLAAKLPNGTYEFYPQMEIEFGDMPDAFNAKPS